MHGNIVDQILNIQSYGISVVGSMIVGFDNDQLGVFDDQFYFLQAAYIPIPRLNVLRAYSGTDLYTRLRREGRLIDLGRSFPDDPLAGFPMRSNIIFKTMSRADVYSGYLRLMEQVWDWRNFRDRMLGFIDNLTKLPEQRPDPRLIQIGEDLREVMHGIPMADPAVIDEVYAYIREKAPSRIWNIATMMLMQCFEAARLPAARGALIKQIDMERTRELIFVQRCDESALVVA
jgi:hypothetical protein